MTQISEQSITGRDDHVISKALLLAIRALRASKFPAESDIADMQLILETRYANLLDDQQAQLDFQRAYHLGFRPDGSFDAETVHKWLTERDAEHTVVSFIPSKSSEKD